MHGMVGTNRQTRFSTSKGFTLVELMVSMAMISILAVALGVSMQRSHKRSSQVKTSLTEHQNQSYLLSNIARKIQWATEITDLTPDSITFSHPIPTTQNIQITTYSWDNNKNELTQRIGVQPTTILAENIYAFNLQADQIVEDSTTLIQGIYITIQFSPEAENTLKRYIKLPNQPAAPEG
ncbi:MAG: type II secretion system protein [Planctomycetes bacterium]|nr:type II secretion system protein [Planctomycetota bacterium]